MILLVTAGQEQAAARITIASGKYFFILYISV
jgi:hypothetical protein